MAPAPPPAELEKQPAEGRSRPTWWELTEAADSEEDETPCQVRRCLEVQAEAQRLHMLLKGSGCEHARLQAEIERMQSLLQESGGQHAKLQAEVERMQSLLQEGGGQHAKLQADVEHLQSMLADSTKQQEKLQATNISLASALQGAQDEKALAQAEAKELRSQLAERDSQMTQLQESSTTLSCALEAARRGEARAIDAVATLRKEHESLQLQLQQQQCQQHRQQQKQQQQQQTQKRDRQPKHSQRSADESVGQGNCSPTALTSLTAELHKAQMALVSIVPELERRLEEKDFALVHAEKRLQSLLGQLDSQGRGNHTERRNVGGLQDERDGVYAKTEQRMHTTQASGPPKPSRPELGQSKSEARLAMERHSTAVGVGRGVPPAG